LFTVLEGVTLNNSYMNHLNARQCVIKAVRERKMSFDLGFIGMAG
jgi:hypothetical protein